MKQRQLLKSQRFWLAIALFGLLLLWCCTPLRGIFNKMFLVQKLGMLGRWAALLFILAHILATILGVPGTILTVAGGAVFGVIWGTLWSVVGATLGALGAFWLARYLLHDWVERKFGHHKALARFNQAVMHKPLVFVLAVRFAPISPFNVVNFLFGLTPIDTVDYTIGTFLGIIPGTLVYTWLGVTGQKVLEGGDRLPFFLALGLLTLLSCLPVLAKKKARS